MAMQPNVTGSTPSTRRAMAGWWSGSGATRTRPATGYPQLSRGCCATTDRWSAPAARPGSSPNGSTTASPGARICCARAEEKLHPLHPVAELGVPHRRWRLGASRALKAGRALLDDGRHAPHLDALGGRAHVERAVARIEKAALLDRLPAGVVRAWEALEDRLRETGRHRFFLTEHERACRLMADARNVRDGKAQAFMGRELRLRKRMGKEAKELHDVVGRLRECNARREEAQAGEVPFVRQEGYGQWWADAWDALQDAKPLLERKKDLALHFADDPDLGEDLETLAAAFEEVLPGEREQRRRVLAEEVREEQSQAQRRNMSRSRGFRM